MRTPHARLATTLGLAAGSILAAGTAAHAQNDDPSQVTGQFTLVDAAGPCILIGGGASVEFPELTIGTGAVVEGDVQTQIVSCSTNGSDPQAVTQSISTAAGAVSGAELQPLLCPLNPLEFELTNGSGGTPNCATPGSDQFGYGGASTVDFSNYSSLVGSDGTFGEFLVAPGGNGTALQHFIIGPDVGATPDTYQFDLTYTAFFPAP